MAFLKGLKISGWKSRIKHLMLQVTLLVPGKPGIKQKQL